MAGLDPGITFGSERDWVYAINIVGTVTWLAGRADYLDDLRRTAADLDLSERNAVEETH